jgi:ABC-type Na+ efflux pump permease subunit
VSVASAVRVVRASASLELAQLRRNRGFVALTALAASAFLAMVSLFGLTGSRAPVALIDQDGGVYAQRFAAALAAAHHSFALKDMTREEADVALRSGRLVGVITIPPDFGAQLALGKTVPIDVQVDNVNVDLTNDVQRALPAAIAALGNDLGFPGIRVSMVERDVWPRDTEYIPYLVVSALALDALVIAGILGAMATAREWENKTVKLLRLAPAPPAAVLAGKLVVASGVASVALLAALAVIVLCFRVVPESPIATAAALGACAVIFSCVGAWVGALLRRTLAAVPLLFSLAMLLYVDSGALEPTRFDGEAIWTIAHLSPAYYAVGVLEWAFHGLRVTPEPVMADLLVLLAVALGSVALTLRQATRSESR